MITTSVQPASTHRSKDYFFLQRWKDDSSIPKLARAVWMKNSDHKNCLAQRMNLYHHGNKTFCSDLKHAPHAYFNFRKWYQTTFEYKQKEFMKLSKYSGGFQSLRLSHWRSSAMEEKKCSSEQKNESTKRKAKTWTQVDQQLSKHYKISEKSNQ
jgi:hypothetical protein